MRKNTEETEMKRINKRMIQKRLKIQGTEW